MVLVSKSTVISEALKVTLLVLLALIMVLFSGNLKTTSISCSLGSLLEPYWHVFPSRQSRISLRTTGYILPPARAGTSKSALPRSRIDPTVSARWVVGHVFLAIRCSASAAERAKSTPLYVTSAGPHEYAVKWRRQGNVSVDTSWSCNFVLVARIGVSTTICGVYLATSSRSPPIYVEEGKEARKKSKSAPDRCRVV